MENTEIMTVEQTGQLSTNVFSDPEAFQNLFNIVCIIFPGATGISGKTYGLCDCMRYGKQNERFPNVCNAESVCCQRKTTVERAGLYVNDKGIAII